MAMTMPSEVAVSPDAEITKEQRLHPLSWLFVLLQQLKQFAFPLLVLLFTGRGNSYELWGLVGAGALVLYSLVHYFTYRYSLDDEGLVIRSGVLQRSLRHIPFARIHNIGLHQSILHRLMGVAEVRLESAGGAKPEGQMRVLSLTAAHALETQIRNHGRAVPGSESENTESPALPLLALDFGEVIRLGLISNRGMLVVAAGIGALASTGDDLLRSVIDASKISDVVQWLIGWSESQHLGWLGLVFSAVVLFTLMIVVLRLLSVVLAILQYHDFQLTVLGSRLSIQRGLLTRIRGSLPRSRIQAWSLSEGVVHRWLNRQSLNVDSVSIAVGDEQGGLRKLVPVAAPETMSVLLSEWLSPSTWPITQWLPLHPRAWRRQFSPLLFLTLLATAVLVWRFSYVGLLSLLTLPLWWLRAKVWAAHAAYSCANGLIAVREGWLDKSWRFAEINKLQSVQLTQSPFDRRHGMASLQLHTAGASPLEPPLRIRYLPEGQARELQLQLAEQMQ